LRPPGFGSLRLSNGIRASATIGWPPSDLELDLG
jgi:hypothetical protein